MSRYPVLFFCDFPPSNLRGGAILTKRLLEGYAPGRLTVLTGSFFDRQTPAESKLQCEHIVLPMPRPWGRWGIGRIKDLLNWLLLPAVALVGLRTVRRKRLRAILTVAHGYYFVAAAVVSRLASVPLVLLIHDDWVSMESAKYPRLRPLYAAIFRLAARSAAHVYVVSPHMREQFKAKYGLESEVQPPATDYHGVAVASTDGEQDDISCLRIFYAGTLTGAVKDSLDLLVQLAQGEKLREYGVDSWVLSLYLQPPDQEAARQSGWENERVRINNWLSQEELPVALAQAHLLVLPFSFRKEEEYATRQAFPSKTADYLASGKPILVLAPGYSTVVQYAEQFGFAEVVDEPTEDALARGIAKIAGSADYRRALRVNALAVFEKNHNIRRQREQFHELITRLVERAANRPGAGRGRARQPAGSSE